MTLNLLANIIMLVFWLLFSFLLVVLIAIGNCLSAKQCFSFLATLIVMLLISLGCLKISENTNVRVKSETVSIVKVTNTHYVIKKNSELEYHKLPSVYRITSGKSHIKKIMALDWYINAKNQDKIGATYYINPHQK